MVIINFGSVHVVCMAWGGLPLPIDSVLLANPPAAAAIAEAELGIESVGPAGVRNGDVEDGKPEPIL